MTKPLRTKDTISTGTERVLTEIPATQVSVVDLKAQLGRYVESIEESKMLLDTLLSCVDLLAGGTGGVIIAVVDMNLVQELQFSFLDNGLLMHLCSAVCSNIHEQSKDFQTMLHFFGKHSETDRWSQQELEGMAKELPEASAELTSLLAPLQDNPKDGAFILSHRGAVVAASAHLKYSSERYQLVRADGHSCGTRHAAALALAEWLGTSNTLGAVFVRSDGGGVHAMLPSRDENPPLVLHFDSLKDLSQKDMLNLFKARIIEEGMLMQKVKPAMIRPAVRGEHVVTCVNGRVISEVVVADDTSMVIQADTFSKELYVLPRAKFEKNWEPMGEEAPEHGSFKKFRPKPGILRWIYKITAEDAKQVPTGFFKAAWGAIQPVREGDFLAMPASKEKPMEAATEIYLMDSDAVGCYKKEGAEEAKAWHLSQQEMLSIFKERIMRQGRLMKKVEPCMARPGRCGEHVVTCVQGRVTSNVTIDDNTSMVVRAPTIDQELYVLKQAKFLANWLEEPVELNPNEAVNKLLAVQGFKLYYPKPKLKMLYEVSAEDAEEVPTRCFFSSWGALQPIQAGDYLAIPDPQEQPHEVYLMPKEVVLYMQEVQGADAKAAGACSLERQPSALQKRDYTREEFFKAVDTNGDGVVTHDELGAAYEALALGGAMLPAAPSGQQGPCSQEEMVRLFEQRIRENGRVVVKNTPCMIRPGKRGDHVVTYINGRVISDTVIADDSSMVVRGATVDQEEYVLTREKFEANWELEGEPLNEADPVHAKFYERGYRLHRPKPNKKWVYRLEASDLAQVPSRSFVASWGSTQPLREGDFLALANAVVAGDPAEVYLMPPEVLEGYEDCPGGTGHSSRTIA